MIREIVASLAIVGANGADLATTERALRAGAVELNPLMQGSPSGRIAVKSVATAAEIATVVSIFRAKKNKAAWIAVAAVVAFNGGLAVHNARVERSMERAR